MYKNTSYLHVHTPCNEQKSYVATLILGQKNTVRLRAHNVEEASYSFC